ncbi:response regulator transcription factor [Planomonospora sp. ID67723]|uniref:response regulator transcription factor n=1 Tax=Planomonospora sp. ID67723 TaxID=2738134 RepID=UPI0018C3B9EF|nr:response regulator transcription factor [Planomonospora sp. ID67723]MBG0832617.1 response regulator transcription factor [Planomonospora sp. ID67723]
MSNILVVEDDADIRDLVVFQLGQDGHQVCAVADGPAALDAVQQRCPDLIVLDWMLPRLSGLQVCRLVRAMPSAEKVKILMLTVRVTDTDVVESLAAGVDEFMAKPFDLHDLRVRIRTLLAGADGGC